MTTNFKPTTNLEDYIRWQRDDCVLKDWLIRGRISQEFYDEEIKNIRERYSGGLNEADRYLFDSVDEYKAFLCDLFVELSNKGTFFSIDDIITHENEHAEEARKIGLTVKYAAWLFGDGKSITGFIPFVFIKQNMTAEQYVKATKAAKKQSVFDNMMIGTYGFEV